MYMFYTVPLSITRSFSLYTQQWYMSYTFAESSWWWAEELSKTCRILFQKYIWEISASGWFYYKNLSRCTVTWTSNLHIAWDAAICLWSGVYPHILQYFSIRFFFPPIYLIFNCIWWDPSLAKPSLAGGYCNVCKLTLLRPSPVWL